MRHAICLLLVLLSCGLGSCRAQAAAHREPSFSEQQIPLIFPGLYTQGAPEARYQLPAGAQRLELTTAAGDRVAALFAPAVTEPGAAAPNRRPTVLYFYGNAQCLAAALPEVELFRACGANVLIADYLGYGLSGGKPSEAGCYATALALYEHARGRRDIDPDRLIAAGWSLGAAVAIDLASRKDLAGLITFSAYTSKRELARRQFPNVPPEAIEHPFLSIEKIRSIRCPTLIIHGRLDTLVPFAMSEELRKAAAGRPLTHLPIEGAGHNDLFLVGDRPIREVVRDFCAASKSKAGPASRPAGRE